MRSTCLSRPLASPPAVAARRSSPLRLARMTCTPLLACNVAHQPSNVCFVAGHPVSPPLGAAQSPPCRPPLTPLPAQLLPFPATLWAGQSPVRVNMPSPAPRLCLLIPLPARRRSHSYPLQAAVRPSLQGTWLKDAASSDLQAGLGGFPLHDVSSRGNGCWLN